MIIKFKTRWSAVVKQDGNYGFSLELTGPVDGPPVINPMFREDHELTSSELERATEAAVKALLIIE